MKINLVVVKGKIVLEGGVLDLEKVSQLYREPHGVRALNGRIDFFYLGNTVSVTKRGHLTVYIAWEIGETLCQIKSFLTRIWTFFNRFTTSITEIRYRIVNIQLSGKSSSSGHLLLEKLKEVLEPFNTIEVLIGTDRNIARIANISALPSSKFLYIYVQITFAEGKLKVLYSGSYTVITTKVKHLVFWKALCSKL